MYWYGYLIPLVSDVWKGMLVQKPIGNAFLYRLIKTNGKWRPKSRALLNLAAEVTRALAVFEDNASQQNLQKHRCSGVLLEARHYSGYKALNSQINSKLQNSPVLFYSVALSQKAPIYIHWAVICSCFKALPRPSNLLWSQEELADLNRGLSHHSSAQLAGYSQTCHSIYSSPWLKHYSWFRFASIATCVVTLWPSFIRMLWVKKVNMVKDQLQADL